MSIRDHLIRIRPVRPDDIQPLTMAAAQDNHAVISPGSIVEKGDQIIGYVGVVPSVLVWLDSHRAKVRDSLSVLNFFENQLAQGTIMVPCVDGSPLKPYMGEVGYVRVPDVSVFLKTL